MPGFRLLPGFPTPAASSIDAILAVGGGFVAMGTHFDDRATCWNDANHGRVWTSTDGTTWTARPDELFAQAALWQMFEFGDGLMILGMVGSGDPGISCNPPAEPGVTAWRSNDGGATWQRLGRASGLDGARITDVAVSSAGIVAVGAPPAAEVGRGMAWLSADGLAWSPADSMPNVESRLNAVAARGNRVVAFADCCDEPMAWISRDGGRNWFEASLTLDPVGPDDIIFPPTVADITVTGSGFVAVGHACCLYPGPESVPVVLASSDGEDWLGQFLPVERDEIMSRVAALPGGRLLVVGNGAAPAGGPRPDPSVLGGRSWISADGEAWPAGPRFMELSGGFVTAIAAGAQGVVVAGAAAGPGGPRVWFAPLNTFD